MNNATVKPLYITSKYPCYIFNGVCETRCGKLAGCITTCYNGSGQNGGLEEDEQLNKLQTLNKLI